MKALFVDDEREPPVREGVDWDIARDYTQALVCLCQTKYDLISLDHDLGDFQEGNELTGYDIMKWLVERKVNGQYVPPIVRCHSMNPVGTQKIQQLFQRYWV